MAPKLGYKLRIVACLGMATLLSWLTYNNLDTIPSWCVYVAIAGIGLCFVGAFRFLKLERYYEGPRTRMVVAQESSRQVMAARLNRR
jgi:hypothetical protein